MKEKKVAIIIATYNQEKFLEQCLNSIKNKTDYSNYKVFLVDDCSKTEIGKRTKKRFPWIDLTINKNNLGFSKANNVGIKKALRTYNPDYVLLLNDDTEIIQRNWLTELVKVAESDKNIGILGCRLIYPDGSLQNIGGYIKGFEITKVLRVKGRIFDVDHVMGSCLFIKRKVIDKIGGLDEIYSPYLLEDTDYCLRSKRAGFAVKSLSYVKIIHKKGKTIDSLKNKKTMFIRFKNDVIFSVRHLNLKYAIFRILIYLPLVAIFKKRTDEASLKLKNFKLRDDFLINLFLLLLAYAKTFTDLDKIK